MSDLVKNRELIRIEVRWPVTIITENGPVTGEARNITVEGVFVHCVERLSVNETYRMLIKPPGDEIAFMGKLVWSNLEGAAASDTLQGMGFCFVKVIEVHRELLRKTIEKYANK